MAAVSYTGVAFVVCCVLTQMFAHSYNSIRIKNFIPLELVSVRNIHVCIKIM